MRETIRTRTKDCRMNDIQKNNVIECKMMIR